jgi:hypothetical protein
VQIMTAVLAPYSTRFANKRREDSSKASVARNAHLRVYRAARFGLLRSKFDAVTAFFLCRVQGCVCAGNKIAEIGRGGYAKPCDSEASCGTKSASICR